MLSIVLLQEIASTGAAAASAILIIYLVVIVLFIVGWVKILSKAGYSGWWVLLGLVPLVNIIAFFVFAFADWPVLRALRQGGSSGGYPSPGSPPGGGYIPQSYPGGYPPPNYPGGYPPPSYPGGYPPPPPGPDAPPTTPWPG